MLLNGSCHCGAVKFSVASHAPYPYMRCYCSICRKTAGGGGYAINIMAQADTLHVDGQERMAIYQARVKGPHSPGKSQSSPARRHFCSICGSALWIADPRWSQWIYPFASAIDTRLPMPEERIHIMLDFVVPWVRVPEGPHEVYFGEYPDEAIVDWHKRHGIFRPEG